MLTLRILMQEHIGFHFIACRHIILDVDFVEKWFVYENLAASEQDLTDSSQN